MGTRRDSASDKMRRFGVDPLTFMCRVMNGAEDITDSTVRLKLDVAKELLPFAYPKLKSVEMTAHQLHEIVVKIGQTHASAMIEHDDVVPMTTTSPRKQSVARDDDDDTDDDA